MVKERRANSGNGLLRRQASVPLRPEEGYYRLAVAQIDSHPAFSLRGHDLLCEPWFTDAEHMILEQLSPSDDSHREQLRQLKESITRVYCAVLEKRVHAIIKWCAQQQVQLVAFPEYSIPAPLLPSLHELARAENLTVIAGTHHVTPRLLKQGTYDGFVHQPKIGNAVAPILGLDVPRLITKLTCSQWEPGSLQPGDLWELVPWRDGHSFAVLICLDTLHPENPQRAKLVTPEKMRESSFQVVCSLTPQASTEQFDKALEGQLRSYHRPALFVNTASAGGSRIFVVESPAGPHAESLPPREDAVLVWDIKLTHHALKKPTGSEFIAPARHIATANLLERGALPGYAECLRQVEAATTMDEVMAVLQPQRTQIETWRRQRTIPQSVQARFGQLLDRIDDLTDVEGTKTLLRNIPLPDDVPKLDELRLYSTRMASSVIQDLLTAERSAQTISARNRLEQLNDALKKRSVSWSDSLERELPLLAKEWQEPSPIRHRTKTAKPARTKTAKTKNPKQANEAAKPQSPRQTVRPQAEAQPGVTANADRPESTEDGVRELGSPALPQDAAWRNVPEPLWALLHEQRCNRKDQHQLIRSRIRLGRACGWLLRAHCQSPEGLDFLWWRDEHAARERLEVIPETCEKKFTERLALQKHRLAKVEPLIDWDIEPTAPKLRRELSALLELPAHARSLIDKYEQDAQDLPRRYVSLTLRREGDSLDPAEQVLSEWWEDGSSTFFLLGDFGGGKTTTLRRFARDCAVRFLGQPELERAPVLIDLRNAGTTTHPVELAREVLQPGQASIDDLVCLALEHGLIGLLFDGLDELLRRDSGEAREQLQRFTNWSSERNARVLISGRTRLFATEEEAIFKDGSSYQRTALLDSARNSKVIFSVLQPLDAPRIRQYLDSCIPEQANALERFIHDTPGLRDFAAQPLLLSLIITLSGHILAEGKREVALSALYQQYIAEWLHDRSAELPPEDRERMVREVAWSNWHSDETVTLDVNEARWRELRTAPFLRIEGAGTLKFVHTSFLEYFLALHIVRNLEAGDESPLPSVEISPEVALFLVGLFDSRGGLAPGLLDALSRKGRTAAERARAVCASYLVHARRSGVGEHLRDILAAAWGDELRLDRVSLRGRSLRYVSFRRAHLSGADLSGCDLSSADLSDAMMYQTRLDSVSAPAANLRGANLSEASLDAVQLKNANLDTAQLYEASLCGADLTGATLREAQLVEARLRSADLTGADCSGANMQGSDLSAAILHSSRMEGTRLRGARWSGASLRNTETKAIVDAPDEKLLAPFPPLLPFEIHSRPLQINGATSWVGPHQPLVFLAASPSGDLIFLTARKNSTLRRRSYVLDGRCGHLLSFINERITELRFSPSGTALFALCEDNIGLLLDCGVGRILTRESLPYNEHSVEFCANESRLILLCIQDGQRAIRVLSTLDGSEVYTLPRATAEQPFQCSPDGTRALLHDANDRAYVIDVSDGRVLLQVPACAKRSVLSASGRLAVATSSTAETNFLNREEPKALDIRVYDVGTGSLLAAMQLERVLGRLGLSADGTRLVVKVESDSQNPHSRTAEGTVKIYDLEATPPRLVWEGESVLGHRVSAQVDRIVFLDPGGVLSVHRLSDGNLIVRGKIFNGRYRLELREYDFDATGTTLRVRVKMDHEEFEGSQDLRDGHWSELRPVAPSAANRSPMSVITAEPIGLPIEVDLASREGQQIKLRVLPLPRVALCQLLTNDRLLVAHANGLVRVFALPRIGLIFEYNAKAEASFHLLPDERLILQTSDAIEVVRLTGQPAFRIQIPWDGTWARSSDWRFVGASHNRRGKLQIHSMSNGTATASISLREPSQAQWQFLGADRVLVLDAKGRRLRLIDASTGAELLATHLRGCSVSPGDDFLVLTKLHETVVHETRQGTLLASLPELTGRYGWSGDGSWLVYQQVGSFVCNNLRTGDSHNINANLEVGVCDIHAISSDSARLLVGRGTKSLAIVNEAGECLALSLPKDFGHIKSAAFSPKNTHVLLSDGYSLLVYDASHSKLLWDTDTLSDGHYYLRGEMENVLPSFTPDGQEIVDEEGRHYSLDSGARLPTRSSRDARRTEGYVLRAREDGAILLRHHSQRGTSAEVALYPSGSLPYAVSASGRLALPDRWQERWPGTVFDIVGPNGRHPLSAVAADLCCPDLLARELTLSESDG